MVNVTRADEVGYLKKGKMYVKLIWWFEKEEDACEVDLVRTD